MSAGPTHPLAQKFPNLAATAWEITSDSDAGYNCIAWAAGQQNKWWWPVVPSGCPPYFWPPGVPRVRTLQAFVEAYATLGYGPCSDGNLEPGFEKVALYADAGGPTHAARQLSTGQWTSKLGPYVDIEHALVGLNGGEYGDIACFLRRPQPARIAKAKTTRRSGRRRKR